MRTINSKSNKISFKYMRGLFNNCHMGQRKLLFSEIEFLYKVSKYVNISDCLLIYIGASPGIHLHIIKQLFPDIYLVLYDKKKIKLDFKDNLIIFDGSDGLFNDSKIEDLLKLQIKLSKKYILLISDIRNDDSVKNEYSIWEEMQDQQRWGIKLNADFMLLKFRLPWLNKYIENNYLHFPCDKFILDNKLIKITKKELKSGDVQYLKGIIYTQLYTSSQSSETRLFVKKKNGKYKIKNYNCYEYEDKICYYNTYTRNKEISFLNSNILCNSILGYDNKYPSVCEYYIIYKYLKYYKKNIINYDNNIIQILFDISFTYAQFIANKFNIFCILYTYKDYIESISKALLLDKLDLIKNDLKIFYKQIKILNNNINITIENNKLELEKKNFMIDKLIKTRISINNNMLAMNINNLINYDINHNKFTINLKVIKSINKMIIEKVLESKIIVE